MSGGYPASASRIGPVVDAGDEAVARRRCAGRLVAPHGSVKGGAARALNRQLLKAALGTRRSVTLDLDATAILCDKREARYTYQKERGYMPIVGHIAEVGMIVSQQFRHGNVPPSKDNLRFIVQCGAALPTGVKIGHLRIDAAGYQAAILDHAAEPGMAFAIRATLSKSLREQIQGLAASAWQPVVDRAGQSSEEESSCRLVHSMGASKRAFTLVLQRRPKWGQQSLDVGCGVDTDTYEQGGYVYRAIATNRDALSDREVIHWYNQRGEHSENRIKELKCDFGGDRLPCGQFSANELYTLRCARWATTCLRCYAICCRGHGPAVEHRRFDCG